MAFRGLLLEAVTRDEALKTLNRETQAEDGALDLYRNGKVVPRQYIRGRELVVHFSAPSPSRCSPAVRHETL